MRKLTALVAVVVTAMVAASSASAARQDGLVNINVENNIVQVPLSVAANVCDVDVVVLAANLADFGSATCDAFAESGGTVTPAQPSDRRTRQAGLINVNIEGNTVQVPIAVAANLCDIDIVVLATGVLDAGDTTCDATAGSQANG